MKFGIAVDSDPDTSPVFTFKLSPAGNEVWYRANWYGFLPPEAIAGEAYASPTSMSVWSGQAKFRLAILDSEIEIEHEAVIGPNPGIEAEAVKE